MAPAKKATGKNSTIAHRNKTSRSTKKDTVTSPESDEELSNRPLDADDSMYRGKGHSTVISSQTICNTSQHNTRSTGKSNTGATTNRKRKHDTNQETLETPAKKVRTRAGDEVTHASHTSITDDQDLDSLSSLSEDSISTEENIENKRISHHAHQSLSPNAFIDTVASANVEDAHEKDFDEDEESEVHQSDIDFIDDNPLPPDPPNLHQIPLNDNHCFSSARSEAAHSHSTDGNEDQDATATTNVTSQVAKNADTSTELQSPFASATKNGQSTFETALRSQNNPFLSSILNVIGQDEYMLQKLSQLFAGQQSGTSTSSAQPATVSDRAAHTSAPQSLTPHSQSSSSSPSSIFTLPAVLNPPETPTSSTTKRTTRSATNGNTKNTDEQSTVTNRKKRSTDLRPLAPEKLGLAAQPQLVTPPHTPGIRNTKRRRHSATTLQVSNSTKADVTSTTTSTVPLFQLHHSPFMSPSNMSHPAGSNGLPPNPTMGDLANLLSSTGTPTSTNATVSPPHYGPIVLCPGLPETCEVNDPALQDILLMESYKNLCPLRRGIFTSWSTYVGRGQVNYSTWMTHIPEMSLSTSHALIVFNEFKRWVNPSRATPLAVTLRQANNNNILRYNVYRGEMPAIALSSGYLWDSYLTVAKNFGLRQKMVSVILHKQEWERLVAWCCMVFNVDTMAAQVSMSALQFSTRSDWNANVAAQMAHHPTHPTDDDDDMFSHTPSPAVETSSAVNADAMTISANSTIPVYDIRGVQFEPERDLPKLSSFPRWNGEIPRGSFVTVGYTIAAYYPNQKWNLATNLQFVLVVGVPHTS